MAIIYDDAEPHTHFHGFKGTPDCHKNYVKHLGNWFYLKFIVKNTSSLIDKFQATRELAICECKLDYWYKKPDFDPKQIELALDDLKTKWILDFRADDFDDIQRKWIASHSTKKRRK
jgi:hypothetical protein